MDGWIGGVVCSRIAFIHMYGVCIGRIHSTVSILVAYGKRVSGSGGEWVVCGTGGEAGVWYCTAQSRYNDRSATAFSYRYSEVIAILN